MVLIRAEKVKNMLKLSKMADYAGVIVVQMVREPNRTHTASSLADGLSLPKATVAKCLKMLAKSGILTSQRGVNGGYRLARPAGEISVAQVIGALEGPVQIADCIHSHANSCQIVETCPMRGGWDGINAEIQQMLQNKTVADMARSVA